MDDEVLNLLMGKANNQFSDKSLHVFSALTRLTVLAPSFNLTNPLGESFYRLDLHKKVDSLIKEFFGMLCQKVSEGLSDQNGGQIELSSVELRSFVFMERLIGFCSTLGENMETQFIFEKFFQKSTLDSITKIYTTLKDLRRIVKESNQKIVDLVVTISTFYAVLLENSNFGFLVF